MNLVPAKNIFDEVTTEKGIDGALVEKDWYVNLYCAPMYSFNLPLLLCLFFRFSFGRFTALQTRRIKSYQYERVISMVIETSYNDAS